jgi:hypothetical protein
VEAECLNRACSVLCGGAQRWASLPRSKRRQEQAETSVPTELQPQPGAAAVESRSCLRGKKRDLQNKQAARPQIAQTRRSLDRPGATPRRQATGPVASPLGAAAALRLRTETGSYCPPLRCPCGGGAAAGR